MMLLSVKGVGQTANISISGNISYTYNGLPQFDLLSTNISVTGGCTQSSLPTYIYSGSDFIGNSYNSSTKPTNAGNYQIIASATFSCGTVSSNIISFTIGKATPTITVTPGTYTYTGSAQGPGVTETNTGGSTSVPTFLYIGTSYPSSSTKPTKAGSYQVTASVVTDANYITASSVATSFTINKKLLTITIDALDKVYDGITYATGTITSDKLGSDIIAISSSSVFNNKNIGIGKAVTTTITSITGTDAGNYSLTSATATGTASITVKSLTVSATVLDKVYDGNTTANATLTDNRITGDVFTVDKTGATFNNKNIGTGKAVTVAGITLTGTDAGNYTLTSSTSTGTASITVKSLTITATASDKVYDGNTTATATLTDNRITGDVFTVDKTAAFNNKNIGISKAVAVSGITLTGADAGNYSLTSATASGTASITVKSLTISATVSDKVYDGNAIATATLTDNRITGDVFTVDKTATFNNKNIGTGKTVTVSAITLTGTDAGNYSLTNTTATGTASITVKSLTISATASDKEYDGNTTATASLTDNRVSGDVLTINKTGSAFNNKNIGTGKAVTVSGINITGADVGNYSLTSTTASGTASITVKSLTISATASDKEYDGNTTATATLTDNRITGDIFTVNKTGATFNNKNIGTSKAVTVSGINITGADAGNYSLTSTTASGTASLTVKSLTITATVSDKEYDGNITATVNLTDNRITGDVFTVDKTATFNNKNIGTGKAVIVAGITLTGTDAGNYTITSSTATGTASITVKSLTITATAIDKQYDGNTTATATLTDNRITGDVFTVDKTEVTFDNKNIGTGKAVTVAGITLTGTDAGNYTLTSATASGTASITAAGLTVTATALDKVYDGNKTASVSLSSNKISSDVVTLTKTLAEFDSKDFGTGKTVNVTGIAISGTDAGNYTLTSSAASGTASITAKLLNITARPHTIIYKGTAYTGGNGLVLVGLASGESISNLTGTLTYAGTSQGAKNVGSYTIIPGGLSSSNYNINYVGDNLEIKKATLKVIAGDQSVNFGTPAAKILTDATFTYASLLGGDNASTITGSISYSSNYTPLTSTGSTGIYIEPIITGLSATNYDLIAEKGNITITAPPSSPVFQIPNAFTPNSDGHNDTFKIIENGYVTSIIGFKIFTKSGKLIFSDKDGAWDGRYAGVMLDSDVYIWIADFINKNNIQEHLTGTVLLLK
jgi:gliding motility-associated-like protein